MLKKAMAAAESEYVPPAALPASLRSLNYDQWRTVRFKPERSLWRFEKLPFELQFFHSGFYYDRNVDINVVEEGQAVPVLKLHLSREAMAGELDLLARLGDGAAVAQATADGKADGRLARPDRRVRLPKVLAVACLDGGERAADRGYADAQILV